MNRGFVVAVASASCLFLICALAVESRFQLNKIILRFDHGDNERIELKKKDESILLQLAELRRGLDSLLNHHVNGGPANYEISFKDLVRIAPGQELRVVRDSWRDRTMANWSEIGKRDTPEGFTWVGTYREAETETVFQLYLEVLK